MSAIRLVRTKVGVIPLTRNIHSSLAMFNASVPSTTAKTAETTPTAPSDTQTVAEVLSESTNQKELISGAPADLSTPNTRLVRIYKEAKAATQSSARNSLFWKMDWDIIDKQNRWENDLIGYQGTSDIMQATTLNFENKDAAIMFAKGQGWDYYIQEPKTRKFKKKDYSANFYHSYGPLKHIRTK